MKRRDFLKGVAALATYAQLREAEAQVILLGGIPIPALLTDTFLRADTVAPSLGVPTALTGFATSQNPWQMFGPVTGAPSQPGPPIGGNISSHQFACLAGQVVYAEQRLSGPVVRWGAEVNFIDGGGVTNFGTTTMLSSVGSNTILNAAHFVVTRVGARIETIINGVFTQLANIGFGAPYLPKSSKFVCTFSIDGSGNWVLRYAGRQITGTNPELLPLIGAYFTAELYQLPGTDVDSLPRYNQLFAATAGQPTTFLENELIPDPSFSAPGSWTTDPCWVVSGGVATKTAGTSGNLIPNPNIVPVVGGTYLVTYEITSFTAGAFLVGMGGVNGAVRTAAGVYSEELVGIANTNGLTFFGNSAGAGVVDNMSCVRTA